jgi:two-component system NtrC family sensor kinase
MEKDNSHDTIHIPLGMPGLMSFRMRLITAFVVLIVCSASATILIGNTVFGDKVDELAESKAAVDLKVAEQIFSARLEKLRLLTMAVSGESNFDDPSMCRLFLEEIPAGTSAFYGDDDSMVCIFGGRGKSGERDDIEYLCGILHANGTSRASGDRSGIPGNEPRSYAVGEDVASAASMKLVSSVQIAGTPLSDIMERSRETGTTEASVVVFERSDLRTLGCGNPLERELFMLSASPLSGGRVFIAGYSLNGNNGIVSYIRDEASLDKEAGYASTIFLGETRISTTLGDGFIGTGVDPEVAETVLKNGTPYVGIADVAGESYYSAYSPLRDYSGHVVGMLGIGTPESVHSDVRHRTNTLFSSLIGGGMIFGFIMAYIFSSLLMKPVLVLTEGVERVAEGDLNYKVRIKTRDELGRLARSFNTMVRGIKERDMKLREMTEKQLSRVEKQVSIGRLAAGVAHEINNPLTAILTLSHLTLKHLKEEDPRRDDLIMIAEETDRCRNIVRGLLDFARESQLQKEVVDINKLLSDTLTLTSKYDAMEDIELDLRLFRDPLYAAVDTQQMQQVFSNILLNAAEAVEGGEGNITITTDEDSSGGFVSIVFRDNGKGISRENLETVFEPFYTSKEKGTGLGLSVSLGIARRHNGTIEIESEPGRGTKVTVIIPRFDEDA